MQNEYYIPSLAEIMNSPESLQKAADDFVKFCIEQNNDEINNNIEIDKDFLNILDNCGEKDDKFYEKICKIDIE